MGIEGELLVGLRRGEDGMEVSIRSSRPLAACRVFVGKGPAQLLETLPLLYGICGLAQSAAAQAALEDAAGVPPAPAIAAAREMLLLAETAREHAWRVLLDWPAVLGEPPNQAGLAALMQFPKRLARALFRDGNGFGLQAALQVDAVAAAGLVEALERLLEEAVFGIPPGTFFEIDHADSLLRWQAEQQTPAARMLREIALLGWTGLGQASLAPLPSLDRLALESRLGGTESERFIAAPEWLGTPRETGPRTRLADHPLLASTAMRGLQGRLLARLLELARIPVRLRILLQGVRTPDLTGFENLSGLPLPDSTGTGIGMAEAARGRLFHRVVLDEGRVGDYRILAPTEWNFHPRGVAALALATLDPEADPVLLERQAMLLIHAIDPCVGCRVEIG